MTDLTPLSLFAAQLELALTRLRLALRRVAWEFFFAMQKVQDAAEIAELRARR